MSLPQETIPKRSGSERRQRGKCVSVRLLPTEQKILETKARTAGLSTGAFLRLAALGETGPRSRRGIQLNAELLAHAVAQLNKVGSNLNQIARTLNATGVHLVNDNAVVLTEVRAAVAEIRAALGERR